MGNGADTGREHGPRSPEQIRNVVLVGPAGVGKSTLFERLIAARVAGRHQRGEPGPSQSLGAASIASGEVMINLLDTPGNPDFVGEVRAGLRAADAVLFVVSASDEIDDATRFLWRECESTNMPRAIAVTKLEQSRADFDETIARCRRVFGDVQPVGAPLIEDGHVAGAINLLRRSVTDYRSGEPTAREPDETEAAIIEEHWDPLIESIIEESEDETLLDRHLSGEPIDLDIVLPDLRAAVATGRFFPIIPAHAPTGMGIEGLLELFEQGFPSPASAPLPAVYKPSGEPFGAGEHVTLRVHWSLRWYGQPATRLWAGSRWFGFSPALSALTLRYTYLVTCSSLRLIMSTPIRTTTATIDELGPSRPRSEMRPGRSRTRSPVILSWCPSWPLRKPPTRCPTRRSLRSSSRGCCLSRCYQLRSTPAPVATRRS